MPLGLPEIAIILVILLVVFGGKRLPALGRSLGTGMREFKDGITGGKKDDDDDANTALPRPEESKAPDGDPTSRS